MTVCCLSVSNKNKIIIIIIFIFSTDNCNAVMFSIYIVALRVPVFQVQLPFKCPSEGPL
jgi:hypothetical protein